MPMVSGLLIVGFIVNSAALLVICDSQTTYKFSFKLITESAMSFKSDLIAALPLLDLLKFGSGVTFTPEKMVILL